MNNLSFHITDITANRQYPGECFGDRAVRRRAGYPHRHPHHGQRLRDGCGNRPACHEPVLHHPHDSQSRTRPSLPDPECGADRRQCHPDIRAGKGNGSEGCLSSDHIDCPPWGDLPGTVALLITGNPEINVCFEYRSGETGYSISTNEIKEILDGVPLSYPKVMLLIKEMIKENIRS